MSGETSTIQRATRIPLPELLQALAHQRQNGLLEVSVGDRRLLLLIDEGHLAAISGLPPGGFLRAAVWGEVVDCRLVEEVGGEDVLDLPDYDAARLMVKKKVLDQKRLKEAIEVLLAEAFCDLLSTERRWEYVDEVPVDQWMGLLQKLKVALPMGGLLMEAVRRQDELAEIEDFDLDPNDLLKGDPDKIRAAELDDRERAVAEAYARGLTFAEVARETWIPDWHVRFIAASLQHRGLLRLAAPADLVVQADADLAEGRNRRAEGLYRRSLARGSDFARVYLALGELGEEREDHEQASADYLTAASRFEATRPEDAVAAYEKAMELGADPEPCLNRLFQIYTEQGDDDQRIDVLFALADHHRRRADLEQASQVVARAEQMGADRRRCVRYLADLAAEEGARDQALAQWQTLAHLCAEADDAEGLRLAREKILDIDPGRLPVVQDLAQALIQADEEEAAVRRLRAGIGAPIHHGDLDHLIACRELLAKLDPDDASNTAWLSKAYHKRSDRDEGVQRLYELAERQADAADDENLRKTLARLVDLDGSDMRAWGWLAETEWRMGLTAEALRSWHKAVDAAIANEEFGSAREMAEVGLAEVPCDLRLQLALVRCASRLGDLERAREGARSAGRLALVAGEAEVALQCYVQLLSQVHGDLALHAEAIEAAEQLGDDERLVEILEEAIRAAEGSHDFGLAVRWSELLLRHVSGDSWLQRERHIELLGKAGDEVQMLQRGRELAVDLMADEEAGRELRLLERLIKHFPNETVLHLRHVRLCAETNRVEEFRAAFPRAVAVLQQAGEADQARELIEEMRSRFPEEQIFDRLSGAIEEGRSVTETALASRR